MKRFAVVFLLICLLLPAYAFNSNGNENASLVPAGSKEIDYEIIPDAESLQTYSLCPTGGVLFDTIVPHQKPCIYQVIFNGWKSPENVKVYASNGKIHVLYQEDTNLDEKVHYAIRFRLNEEIYVDGFTLYKNGDPYDNRNIKAIFGME